MNFHPFLVSGNGFMVSGYLPTSCLTSKTITVMVWWYQKKWPNWRWGVIIWSAYYVSCYGHKRLSPQTVMMWCFKSVRLLAKRTFRRCNVIWHCCWPDWKKPHLFPDVSDENATNIFGEVLPVGLKSLAGASVSFSSNLFTLCDWGIAAIWCLAW